MPKPKLNISEGTEIALIKGDGPLDGLPVTYSNKKGFKRFKYLKLDDRYKFEPCANSDVDKHGKLQRIILYITGPSGSGKSTYVKMFLRNYKIKYPDNNIYLFSKVQQDDSLDDIPGIKRAIIDKNLIEDPLDVSDLKNSVVIFDDVDDIPEISKEQKEIKKALEQLRAEILSTGRHYNVSMLNTSHEACNSHKTKKMLNESHYITIFPNSGQSGLDYFCDKYLGIKQKNLDKLRKLETRWITLGKQYPTICYTEREIFPLLELNDMVINELYSSGDENDLRNKQMKGQGFTTLNKKKGRKPLNFYDDGYMITCPDCKKQIKNTSLSSHLKSKTHLNAIEGKDEDDEDDEDNEEAELDY